MSLTFNNAATDRVDIGAGIVDLGLSSFTICAWVNPSSFVNGAVIYGGRTNAGSGAAASVVQLRLNTTGDLILRLANSVGGNGKIYTTTSTPLAPAGNWRFVCAVYDSTAGSNQGTIYSGSLTSMATAQTITTAETNAVVSETAGTNLWGARTSAGAVTNSFSGKIALGMLFSRALSAGEIMSVQFHPRKLSGCVDYQQFGYNGTGTQADWSGNAQQGTVTGATLTPDHVPLRSPFVLGI